MNPPHSSDDPFQRARSPSRARIHLERYPDKEQLEGSLDRPATETFASAIWCLEVSRRQLSATTMTVLLGRRVLVTLLRWDETDDLARRNEVPSSSRVYP